MAGEGPGKLGPPEALADKFFEAACEQGSALQRLLERLAADDTSWYGESELWQEACRTGQLPSSDDAKKATEEQWVKILTELQDAACLACGPAINAARGDALFDALARQELTMLARIEPSEERKKAGDKTEWVAAVGSAAAVRQFTPNATENLNGGQLMIALALNSDIATPRSIRHQQILAKDVMVLNTHDELIMVVWCLMAQTSTGNRAQELLPKLLQLEQGNADARNEVRKMIKTVEPRVNAAVSKKVTRPDVAVRELCRELFARSTLAEKMRHPKTRAASAGGTTPTNPDGHPWLNPEDTRRFASEIVRDFGVTYDSESAKDVTICLWSLLKKGEDEPASPQEKLVLLQRWLQTLPKEEEQTQIDMAHGMYTDLAAVHKAATSMTNGQIARVMTSLMEAGVGETKPWPQNVKSVGSMFILQQPLKVPQDEGNAAGNSKGGDGGKAKDEATDGAESTKQELAINVEFHKQLQLIVDECAMPKMSSTTVTCLLLPSTNDLPTKTQEQLKAVQLLDVENITVQLAQIIVKIAPGARSIVVKMVARFVAWQFLEAYLTSCTLVTGFLCLHLSQHKAMMDEYTGLQQPESRLTTVSAELAPRRADRGDGLSAKAHNAVLLAQFAQRFSDKMFQKDEAKDPGLTDMAMLYAVWLSSTQDPSMHLVLKNMQAGSPCVTGMAILRAATNVLQYEGTAKDLHKIITPQLQQDAAKWRRTNPGPTRADIANFFFPLFQKVEQLPKGQRNFLKTLWKATGETLSGDLASNVTDTKLLQHVAVDKPKGRKRSLSEHAPGHRDNKRHDHHVLVASGSGQLKPWQKSEERPKKTITCPTFQAPPLTLPMGAEIDPSECQKLLLLGFKLHKSKSISYKTPESKKDLQTPQLHTAWKNHCSELAPSLVAAVDFKPSKLDKHLMMTVLASRGSKTQAGIESLYIFDVDIEPLFVLDPTTRQLTSKPDCVEVHLRALPRAGKDGDSLLLESLSGILHCSESRKVQYSIAAEDGGPAHVTISWIVFILFAAIQDVISPTAQMTDDVSQARHKWLEHRVSAFDQVMLASEVSTPGLSEWLRLSQIAAVATMQLKLHDTVRLVVQLGPQSRNDQLHSKSPVLAAVVVAMLRLGTPGLSTDGSNSTAAEWALSAAAERQVPELQGPSWLLPVAETILQLLTTQQLQHLHAESFARFLGEDGVTLGTDLVIQEQARVTKAICEKMTAPPETASSCQLGKADGASGSI